MSVEQIAILTSIIGVLGTIMGTILGWALQFIKRNKLVFSKINVKPVGDGSIQNAFFKLNIHNTSNTTKAIRDPIIITYDGKIEVFKDNVQKTELYNNPAEREQNEKYRTDISLLEIPSNGNISQLCKIEFFNIFELEKNISKAYFLYEDENFKQKKVRVFWNNDNKFNKIKNKEKNNG